MVEERIGALILDDHRRYSQPYPIPGSGTRGLQAILTRVFCIACMVVAVGAMAACGDSASDRDAEPERASGVLPADFIWGVSSSAFQSEGGDVDANWNRYNAKSGSMDAYGRSVDFRHRYHEDIDLAGDLGVNTYRISISWARVEPREGEYDERELAYYDDVIATMIRRGIRPMITLMHWDYPGWLLDQGGWVNPDAVPKFLDYARTIVTRYGDRVDLWVTFNETLYFIIQEMALRPLDPVSALRMNENLVAAHRQAYDLIHGIDPVAKVTSNIAWAGDKGFAPALQLTDLLFIDRVRDKIDFLGFDYYYTNFTPVDFLNSALSRPWDSSIDPFQMYSALRTLSRRYPGLPLMIVENGMPTDNGQVRKDGYSREDVLRDNVYWMQRARADGIDVIGYLYWSITDNFEWGSYSPRFGLYTVDVLTDPSLARKATAAVPVYRQIIRNNGLPASYEPVLGPDCTAQGTPLDPRCLLPG